MVGFLVLLGGTSSLLMQNCTKAGNSILIHASLAGNITKTSVPIIFIAIFVTIALRLPVMSGGTNSRFGLYIVVDH